jgi:hypothetical protein
MLDDPSPKNRGRWVMAAKQITPIICLVSLTLAMVACAQGTPTPTPTLAPAAETLIVTPTFTSTPTTTPSPTSTPTTAPTSTNTPTTTHTPSPTPTITLTPKPADVRLISDLQISNLRPLVGEIVTATFKVQNYGEQVFTAWRFGIKGRGPDGSIQDFFMIPDFSLDPGTGYAYFQNRSFSAPGRYWFTPHYSPDGVNWFDITWPDGRTSQIEITVNSPPKVEAIYVEPSTINQGDAVAIRVAASADGGVQSIRWWSEGTGDHYLDKGDQADCGGATRCEHRWPALKWMGQNGRFTIYAQAADMAGHLSAVVTATITVTARFSLWIGGGAFASESVQNALGFGVDWVTLHKKVGEVVLVDFVSGETLSGPMSLAYRPDSAKELLAGAGYPNGFDVVLLFDPDDQLVAKLADLVASYLSALRIHPEYFWVASTDARARFATIIATGESGLLIERR